MFGAAVAGGELSTDLDFLQKDEKKLLFFVPGDGITGDDDCDDGGDDIIGGVDDASGCIPNWAAACVVDVVDTALDESVEDAIGGDDDDDDVIL
ncbi:hypothetical protein SAMD00019534_122190 [Acytostelium subglobosum LB1]|uniref:hypothetical protein n=1 Tax=Acytostelium subglobosum LB1 TaxID=1410327 RepID=UPI0006450708|nr:hypothetical protein SAMD00019534_122190 [Acytostelium subglobosum LB1]GAM29043.1 hypothetical protein SAMD00019534_122190 [Acytostelium subglobosum LB1]|eukprot:XP_012748049.1 hypothetical protein SAMD00019534_122190 [Acytostelium subglobosum LB1]